MKKLASKITAVLVAAGLMFPAGTIGNIDFGLTAFAEETAEGYTNGFCTDYADDSVCTIHTDCNGYQPATLTTDKYNIDGVEGFDEVYEIGNAGQLYWFAACVNGSTEGIQQNKSAKAVLTANITVNGENFTSWTPIGKDYKTPAKVL